MKTHFLMFARYNEWANRAIYDAAATLSDADYRADRGAFFKSVHGTLNHLLTADRIWLQRFTGMGDAPNRLDAILFQDFAPLWEARKTEDERIIDYVESLDEMALQGSLRYRPVTSPNPVEQPLSEALAHFFNHQSHHRGQAMRWSRRSATKNRFWISSITCVGRSAVKTLHSAVNHSARFFVLR